MQRCVDDGALLRRPIRFTERVTQRPLQKDCAWRADSNREIPGERDADGGYAGSLDNACDQSHGPIAEPSGRGQERKVDAVLAQSGRHIRRAPAREDR